MNRFLRMWRNLRLLSIFAISFLLYQKTVAQTNTFLIKGVVKDEKAELLPGVGIRVKDSKTATQTAPDGSFTISVSDKQAVLVFTYIGYSTLELPLEGRSNLEVTLNVAHNDLSQVVVVGYGQQKRKTLSTAISSVTGTQLKDVSVANPAQALAGQVSGVNITQTGGQPGTAPVIRIRGVGSLSAGNSPLYVVDGYPLASADNFNQINPGDIQSMEILKDAAAAAIYGSRGGNGVILVTTKRGKTGETRFSYNGYFGTQNLSKEISMMNNTDFINFSKESAVNAGLKYYTFYDNPPADLPYTDWQKEIFRSAVITQHDISASGGTDKFRFNLSASYLKQDGILRSTGFERFTIRSNFDAQLTKKLKLGLNLAPSLTNSQYQGSAGTNDAGVIGSSNDPITFALQTPGVFPVKLPNGDYANTQNYPLTQGANSISPNFFGPTSQLDLYKDFGNSPRFLGNMFLEYEIIKGLTFKTSFGAEYASDTRNQYAPATLPSNSARTANLSNPLVSGIAAAKRLGVNSNWLWENTINYNKTIGEHSFAVLAGYTAQSALSTANTITGVPGTFINDLVENVSGAGSTISTNIYSKNTLLSLLGRLNYSYKEKYLFSVAVRQDGSSRFGTQNRYAIFPSASVAWRLAEENFIKNLPMISELKIRGSYGVTGNNNIGDYSAQSYTDLANYDFGAGTGSRVFGYSPGNIANPNLTWETNKQFDLGLELGILKDRFYFTADVYSRRTSGLLNNRNLPAIVGTGAVAIVGAGPTANAPIPATILQNIGEIQNKGIELSLTSRNTEGKFKWTTNANISFNNNKVVSLVNDKPIFFSAGGFTNYAVVTQGHSLGEFYGYQQIGVFKDQADVNAGGTWAAGGSKPGDIKYKDVNSDGKIDANDLTYLGSPLPKFTYGLINNFRYKSFDMNIILQGSQGNKIVAQWLRAGYYFSGNANTITDRVDRWESPSEPGNGMQIRATNTPSGGANNFSSRFVYDASFLRVRTVTFGYTIPEEVAQKLKLQNIRLYASAQNLFTFTNYIGYNPEANDYGNTVAPTYGFDAAAYPLARTFTFGVNVNF